MSKEQQINYPFKVMAWAVMNIIDCFSKVNSREHNLLFRYIRSITKQHLLLMVTFFYRETFLKLLYSYGLHLRVTIRAWVLVQGKHMHIVFITW